MPRIAVVFDQEGSVAADLAIGLEPVGEVIYLVVESAENRRRQPLLESLGIVVWLTADLDDDVRRVRALRPDAILTLCDQWVCLTAELAHGLGLPFHDLATARLLTDKLAQRHRLRERSVDSLRVAAVVAPTDVPAVVDRVRFPAVAKPRTGHGSAHVHRLADAADACRTLYQAFADTSCSVEFLVEELLVGRPTAPFGDFVSVESLVAGDEVVHLVTGKLPLVAPFRTCGEHLPSGLGEDDLAAVRDLTGRALRALGVRTGVTHTEVKLTPDGPRIIEVNGRLGGYVRELYLEATGTDMIEVAGRLALGEPVPAPPSTPDRVFFQYQNLMPITPCRLVEVRHVTRVTARPEITGYLPFVPPGTDLPGGVKTQSLDFITGHASDFDAMFRLLDEILDELVFVFSVRGVEREMVAAAMRGNALLELDCPDFVGRV